MMMIIIIIIIIIPPLKTNTGGEARRKGLVIILQFLQTIIVSWLSSKIWKIKWVGFFIIVIKSQRNQTFKRAFIILIDVDTAVFF